MKYTLKLSLEHMALVNIVARLWNQNDVRHLISTGLMFSGESATGLMFSDESDEEWKSIEEKVTKNLSQLLLPQLLKSKLADFIKPIGLQILEWVRNHRIGFHLRVDLPAEFNWTPQGTVDRKRTAEMLVKDENLDISTRYKLACIYCLEDDIEDLWCNMSEDVKESLAQDFRNRQNGVHFWTHNMKEKKRGSGNAYISYESAFRFCAISGNKMAAEYYLQKQTPAKRGELLIKVAKFVNDADVLCFLLSKMNEEQQIEVFKDNPFKVMQCFLNWPFQCLFIEMADRMWNFLSKQHHSDLLSAIVDKIKNGYSDWNYKKLFGEFWQKSPNALKSFNLDKFNNSHILIFLLMSKDKENFKLILKAVTIAEKIKFFNELGQRFCTFLINFNEWDMLEFFIKECLPSEDAMMKFKEMFEKHINEMPSSGNSVKYNLVKNKHKWDQLFSLSDDSSVFKYDKRTVEDENSSSKRHRSLQ